MSDKKDKRFPNIILVLCDDMGYGDLACYGSKLHKTPILNKLANDGMKFTDFYTAPVCSPSRAALMTGCYPQRVGLEKGDKAIVLMPGDSMGLSTDEVTIPSMLKQKGYATKCIGKWHLGDQEEFFPTRHGFDSYFGIPYSNDMHSEHPSKSIWHFPRLPLMRDDEIIEWDPDQSIITQRYTQEAVDFITEKRDEPFFLYFPHMYVHEPLYATQEFMDNSENGVYGAEVECVDWSMGEIIKTVKEQGIEEDTIIMFSSDNGGAISYGASNAPLRGQKGSTFEGGIRDPFIISWKGNIPNGRVSDEIVTSMDLLPTLAGLVGFDLPDDRIIDGKDISNMLLSDDIVHSEYEAFYYYNAGVLEAVRAGKWKLHFLKQSVYNVMTGTWDIKEKTDLLYNLEEDIGETVNLYDEHPEIVASLSALADKMREDLGDGDNKGKNRRQPGRAKHPIPLDDYAKK